jgi:hypothetical protein
VCDVEMGLTSVQRRASSQIDPTGGVPIPPSTVGSIGWMASMQPMPSFDSVSVEPSDGGVRVPEYVVYHEAQAVPRYLLEVVQVHVGHADELREGSGQAWLQRVQHEREMRARAQQQQQQQMQMQKQQQQQQQQQGATPSATAPIPLHGGVRPARAPTRPMCRYGSNCYRRLRSKRAWCMSRRSCQSPMHPCGPW